MRSRVPAGASRIPRKLGDLIRHIDYSDETVNPAEILGAESHAELEHLTRVREPRLGADCSGSVPVLSASEFRYYGRPEESFEGRWEAIKAELCNLFEKGFAMSVVDIGSNHGYFCLKIKIEFQASLVVGIEGSVGCGNGHAGETSGGKAFLHTVAQSHCVVTHVSWIARLRLEHSFVAIEAWDLDRVMQLRKENFHVDVMLTLSVLHHVDSLSRHCYDRLGLAGNEGVLMLLTELLPLARVHFVEPRNAHYVAMLHEAVRRAGGADVWDMKMIYQDSHYHERQTWLVVLKPLPQLFSKALFDNILSHFLGITFDLYQKNQTAGAAMQGWHEGVGAELDSAAKVNQHWPSH
eukprot:TRINITY_DN3173_c0_g1_i2.p1 TRINITY_DN3173_c0_g1~~TRINITY_DN3173_c0_g1_i2.p1  ORF type:complete len:362 (-),score=43.48 TRINITY_DN3173_c0_g1_i2:190-1242(-)